MHRSLECPVCFKRLHQPMALPCLHTVCKPCADTLWNRAGPGYVQVTCPICRFKTPSSKVNPFRANFALADVLEALHDKHKSKPWWHFKHFKTRRKHRPALSDPSPTRGQSTDGQPLSDSSSTPCPSTDRQALSDSSSTPCPSTDRQALTVSSCPEGPRKKIGWWWRRIK